MVCGGCRTTISDEELFCPHCGTATIPQATRSQVRGMIDRDESYSNRWLRRGAIIGGVGGIMFSAVAMVLFHLKPGLVPARDQANTFIELCLAPFAFAAVGAAIGGLLDVLCSVSGGRGKRRG